MLAARDEKERAAQLITLILHHPKTIDTVDATAIPLLNSIKAELSPEVFAAEVERGKTLNLESVIQQILAEFPEE